MRQSRRAAGPPTGPWVGQRPPLGTPGCPNPVTGRVACLPDRPRRWRRLAHRGSRIVRTFDRTDVRDVPLIGPDCRVTRRNNVVQAFEVVGASIYGHATSVTQEPRESPAPARVPHGVDWVTKPD